MSWEKIIADKRGVIIQKAEDIFSEHKIKCINGHTFEIYSNDILLDKWCSECEKGVSKSDVPDTIISDILKSLSIPYKYKEIVEEVEYEYVIDGKKKFVILSEDGENPTGYNKIVITDLEYPSIKEEIWEAIRNDEKETYIPKKKKKEELAPVQHGCEIETNLYQAGKSEVCSVTKEALKPYPINVNYGVAYIRVSTREQVKDGFSLEAQERYIYEECLKRDLFLKKIYIDRGISGGSTEKRAALAKMREELEKGDWVIVCYVSRMARNTKDLLSISDEIEQKGCHFLIRELQMDITSPAGKLILTMMASQAQFEREQTSERVKSVIAHLKKVGQFRGKPFFGWKMNPDRSPGAAVHIRCEEEVKVIRRIRRLRNKHPELKITAFARKVNEAKIPPPRTAKVWYHKMLKDTMRREGMNI